MINERTNEIILVLFHILKVLLSGTNGIDDKSLLLRCIFQLLIETVDNDPLIRHHPFKQKVK